MYTVLVAVDRSVERAHNQAAFVADIPHAADEVEATVLHVFPHQDYQGAPDHEFEEVESAVAAADDLESEGLPVTRTWEGGEVARKIIDQSDHIDADLIVLGGRKRSGVARVLMGSTATDVLVSAERPVVVTG
jgi:nucleotide-binding universal stress UspA family protein